MIPISTLIPIAVSSFLSQSSFCEVQQRASISATSLHSSSNNNDSYRPIGEEVVGGLHGGKYQFNDYGGFDQSTFPTGDRLTRPRSGTVESQEDRDPKDMPNWAHQMQPSESALVNPEIISIPTNSDPMDGMIYSASIVIQNQERTWEEFYVKLMRRQGNSEFIQMESNSLDEVIIAKPRSGSLAPRGGSSNVCDEGKPYSDSVQIKVIQSQSSNDAIKGGEELWLVAGTEEEKWYYQLKLER
jgi:hypothetical protein